MTLKQYLIENHIKKAYLISVTGISYPTFKKYEDTDYLEIPFYIRASIEYYLWLLP